MKIKKIATIASSLLIAVGFASCDDTVSTIGGTLVQNEVNIVADTLVADTVGLNFDAVSEYSEEFDARASSKLLGRLNVPEYGSLECSFVSQLMCATKMNVPDSIKTNDVDSMRIILTVPRGSLTGDSLTPQQLRVYGLTKELPKNIASNFNPEGYYDSARPLGERGYTLSALAMSDSLFNLATGIYIPIKLPQEMAKQTFDAYRDPEKSKLFAWPQTFAKKYPGVYIEQNFGNGCVGLISSMRFYLYWHYTQETKKKKEGSDEYETIKVTKRDSVCLFASQPEVLSSNRITYKVSDYLKGMAQSGKTIITTPGGYMVKYRFPIQQIMNHYGDKIGRQTVVSKFGLEIPAAVVKNDYGLTAAPHLLMIKRSEYKDFFAQNKIPDGKTSFYAPYSETNKSYTFSGLREYLIDMIAKRNGIKEEDVDFVLIPVIIGTEDVSNPYTGATVTYVTKCSHYIGRPTMTELDLKKSKVFVSFSRQQIK